MRLFKRLKGLPANEKGNVLILTAAAMPLLVGSAGLAIDTIQLSLLKRHLQRAADSGALAGAYAKAQDKPSQPAVMKALTFNNAFPLSTAIATEPTTGTHAGRAVRVQLACTRSLPFMSFFVSTPPTIRVEATAALVYSGRYCMRAGNPGAGPGITFAGNSVVNARCGIISHATGANSIDVDGNATSITASPIAAVGGVPSSSRYQQPTLLLPYSLPYKDPFENLPDPPSFSSCNPQIRDSTPLSEIRPGGCYQGLDVNTALSLSAGTYYLKGDLKLNAGARLTAHGVTLVFTGDTLTNAASLPKIDIDGSAALDIVAPQDPTNPFDGVAMYYDRRAVAMSPGPKIEGNSSSRLEGAFYFPTQDLTFRGNSAMASTCFQLFAFNLIFEGNTTIDNNCDSGGSTRFDATWVRLVK